MQDARQFIANRKRQGISDARQLLLHRRADAGRAAPAPIEVTETLPVASSDPLVPLLLPQKVITNDRYQPPPPQRIDLEYAVPSAPVRRGAGAAPRGAASRRGYFSQPQLPRRRPAAAQPAPQIVRQPPRQSRQYYDDQQADYGYAAPEEFYEAYYEDAGLDDNGYGEVIDVEDQQQFEELYDNDYDDVEEEAEPLPIMMPHRYQQPHRYQPPQPPRRQYDEQLQFDFDCAAAAAPSGNGASLLSRHRQEHRPVIAAAAAVPRAPRPSRSGASGSTPVYRYEDVGGKTYGRLFDADGDVEMIEPADRRRHRSRSPQLSRPSIAAAAAAVGAHSRARHRPSSHQQQQQQLLPLSASSTRAAAASTASASTAAASAAATAAAAAAAAQSRRSVDEVIKAYKVSISGLHHSVTRDDIYELFSSVGTVRKCSMLGSGKAEVVFPVRAEAETAVRRYNNRELDGVPMRLQISMVGIRLQSGGRSSGGK